MMRPRTSHYFCSSKGVKPQKGFTLIELLAVIFIVGIAAGIITLSIGTGGHQQQLRADLRYLYGGMSSALEEAVITQQQLGLHFDLDPDSNGSERHYRYTWLILDSEAQEWKQLENEDFQQQRLADGIEMRLEVEGDELIIGANNQEGFFSLKQSSDSSKPALQPDIYFLSSGEMPEFRLQIKHQDDEEYSLGLKGNMLGQIQWIQGDEQE